MNPCPRMCDGMNNCIDDGSPVEGCECQNPNYVLDGGKCVHPHQCGCTYDGGYLSVCIFSVLMN